MDKRLSIPVETLRQLLVYDPDTGFLYWLERPKEMFASDRLCNAWNAKLAGKRAFTAERSGYGTGSILGCLYCAHRVAWALYYGSWPQFEIDHINGIRSDNRIVNLRCVHHADNLKNQKLRSTNTSGVTGVYFCNTYKKWVSKIKVNYKNISLGYYSSFQEAVKARKLAELIYNFHPNHGRAY